MNWVREFYSAQNRWMEIYLGDLDESHEERLQRMLRLYPQLAQAGLRILELGAGGGQTSLRLAMLGHELTAVELLPESCAHARQLVQSKGFAAKLQVLEGDFYSLELPTEHYDFIFYLDSFGIGSDAEQQHLLRRMSTWLKPQGLAFIEVGNPWYWWAAKGQAMDLGEYEREYDFDLAGSRLLDYWWPKGRREDALHQSLRCYTLPDFELLLQGTGLGLEAHAPGGRVDYARLQYHSYSAHWTESMTYDVLLKKA